MRRYLVVANQTLGGDQLVQAVRERMLRGPSEFWVLVPATKPAHFADRYAADHLARISVDLSESRMGVGRYGEDSGESLAQQRLDIELQRLHEAGAEADGEVGDPRPLHAIRNALTREQADEIIVSTLPHRLSRWLVTDLPHRARRTGLPVTHVAGPAGPPA